MGSVDIMSAEDKSPYYSNRMRIADVKSPKELIGTKERTLEVTVGNTDKPVILSNPNDVADVKSQTMKEMFLEMFKISDEIAKERGFVFMDKMEAKKD